MSEPATTYVPIDSIGIRRRASRTIAVIGNPNSGKSTLFNRLTGLRQTTGNYPGVTVEKHSGIAQLEHSAVELVDLPGIYCLGGFSADEQIAVDVILGRIEGTKQPDGLLFVLDATHLYQGLYLLQQLMDKGTGFSLQDRRKLLKLIGELLSSVIDRYRKLAEEFAARWVEEADDGDQQTQRECAPALAMAEQHQHHQTG